ncbi:TonB-dependent receptor [Alkalicaulis satelles]|uniref:TonB-dependent receptor n=1 Tax=Alkalicaulis satelles TaxID=2609175 RepID=A0A5M6ZSG0_9PROT|nr:TonB-dependent receptor [Alkalicaulis satelles]KAA5805251.1 TonB-dependent receptor [Alkalicaulis satelles]
MAIMKKLTLGASAVALAAMAPMAAVHAQQTSSELRGAVVDVNGQPVAGARVTIIHTPTGSANVATTGSSGAFLQTGLRVGGPYNVLISAPGFEGDAIEGLNLAPGAGAPVRIVLAPAAADVITVTGQAISRVDLNAGVGSNFTARDVANQPSLSRDVISTLNRDPLAISGGPNNLSVAGVNPRFNGVTIDGARQQDNFGLGSNTFATARSPINIDIIESVSLVASDYSVTSSGFTGGLVNVTTRGGTNEFDGAAFYYYRDQDWVGSTTFGGEGSFSPGEFEEKEYGISVRGPIIRDRLFFSFSYDRFETARQVDFAATDVSNGIDPRLFTELNTLVQNVYGIDMLGRPQQAAVPEETERWFLRLDWNINDDHRLQVNYQQTEDSGVSNIGALNFQSAWYDTPTTLKNYTAQLFSDWTPELSTEFRVSYIDYVRGQNCRAADGVGLLRFNLNAASVAGTPLEGLIGPNARTINGGCDEFRHANEYEDTRLQIFGKADYTWNDFIFTVGGEYETLDLYNMFVNRSRGNFDFTGAQNIIDQIAVVDYRNVPSNVARDGAAEWGYSRTSLFGQARWQALPNLELTGGLRYERISTDDTPTFDPSFEPAVGFDNLTTTDGLDLLMPRFSFRWDALDRTTVTGGFGLFAGGDPGVWTSNAFQVPAVRAFGTFTGVTGNSVPQTLLDAVANGTPTAIDAIDPNFSIPSDWKYSLRVEQEFDLNFGGINLGSNYIATAQVLHSRSKDGFLWREAAQTNQQPFAQTGVAPDGRPIYANLEALNVPNRTILTNQGGDESTTITFSLANEFENGFGFFASYANQDIQMVSEGSSSRGISSFRGQVSPDMNNLSPRTSIYQVEHAFKLGFSFERDFFQDLTTRFDLFGQINSGSPFTYTFTNDDRAFQGFALFGSPGGGERPFNNSPLYIPTTNDTRVVYGSGFDLNAFNSFVDRQGLARGEIHDVNSARAPWQQRWDLRVQQDLPGIPGMDRLVGDNRVKLVLDIENVLNLLNDSWGTRVNAPNNGQRPIARADLVRATDVTNMGVDGAPALTGDLPRTECQVASDCLYRFTRFDNNAAVTGFRSNPGSTWYARIGIRYEF